MGATGSDRGRALQALPRAFALALLLLVASSAEGAPGPTGSCRATASGRAVSVRVQLDDLFQPELLRLVSLGLEGRLHVELALLERRTLWFPRRAASLSYEVTMARDARGDGFVLDGDRPVLDPQHLVLERVALPFDGDDPERLRIEARIQLRVITPASLGRMASWVAGGDANKEERSALSAGVLAVLADELARSLELSCPVKRR